MGGGTYLEEDGVEEHKIGKAREKQEEQQAIGPYSPAAEDGPGNEGKIRPYERLLQKKQDQETPTQA